MHTYFTEYVRSKYASNNTDVSGVSKQMQELKDKKKEERKQTLLQEADYLDRRLKQFSPIERVKFRNHPKVIEMIKRRDYLYSVANNL